MVFKTMEKLLQAAREKIEEPLIFPPKITSLEGRVVQVQLDNDVYEVVPEAWQQWLAETVDPGEGDAGGQETDRDVVLRCLYPDRPLNLSFPWLGREIQLVKRPRPVEGRFWVWDGSPGEGIGVTICCEALRDRWWGHVEFWLTGDYPLRITSAYTVEDSEVPLGDVVIQLHDQVQQLQQMLVV